MGTAPAPAPAPAPEQDGQGNQGGSHNHRSTGQAAHPPDGRGETLHHPGPRRNPHPCLGRRGRGHQGAARGRAREEHFHRRDLDLVAASNDPKQAWSTPLSVCILRTGLIQDKPLIKPSQPSSDVVVVTPIGTQPGPLAAANLSGTPMLCSLDSQTSSVLSVRDRTSLLPSYSAVTTSFSITCFGDALRWPHRPPDWLFTGVRV